MCFNRLDKYTAVNYVWSGLERYIVLLLTYKALRTGYIVCLWLEWYTAMCAVCLDYNGCPCWSFTDLTLHHQVMLAFTGQCLGVRVHLCVALITWLILKLSVIIIKITITSTYYSHNYLYNAVRSQTCTKMNKHSFNVTACMSSKIPLHEIE